MRIRLLCAVAWLSITPGLLEAQHTALSNLMAQDVDAIRSSLSATQPSSADWLMAAQHFFGPNAYDPKLLDLMVYVPSSGPVRMSLLGGNQDRSPKRQDAVLDEEFAYVVIISDQIPTLDTLVTFALDTTWVARADSTGALVPTRVINADTVGSGTVRADSVIAPKAGVDHLSISVRSLQHARDPFLTAAIKAFAGLFSTSAPEAQLSPGEDSVQAVKLERVGSGTRGDMYAAIVRVPIALNANVRVTIRPIAGYAFPAERSVHYQFRNSANPPFAGSLGFGATFAGDRPTYDADTVASREAWVRPKVYVLGHFYLNRPHLPRDPRSLALSVGTAVGTSFEDILVGLSYGRWYGLGVVAGINWLTWPKEEGVPQPGRIVRPFVAVDFGL